MSGNAVILQEDIDNFILTEVKPRIDGFKVIETRGIWKRQNEDSFDIIAVMSDEFSSTMKKLQKNWLLYKAMFAQNSVLLFYERAEDISFNLAIKFEMHRLSL